MYTSVLTNDLDRTIVLMLLWPNPELQEQRARCVNTPMHRNLIPFLLRICALYCMDALSSFEYITIHWKNILLSVSKFWFTFLLSLQQIWVWPKNLSWLDRTCTASFCLERVIGHTFSWIPQSNWLALVFFSCTKAQRLTHPDWVRLLCVQPFSCTLVCTQPIFCSMLFYLHKKRKINLLLPLPHQTNL